MPECAGCGATFSNEFQFCPHCGRPKPEAPKLEVEFKEAPNPLACPLCGRVDQVQKVSSIYAAGTHHSAASAINKGVGIGHSNSFYTSGYGNAYGSGVGVAVSVSETQTAGYAQSELAAQLAPPAAPVRPQRPLRSTAAGEAGFWLGGPVGFIAGIVLLFVTSPNPVGFLFLLVGPVAGIAIGVWLGYVSQNGVMKRANAEYAAAMRDYTGELDIYRHYTIPSWESLYYCHRDDIVWSPGYGGYGDPTVTDLLLNNLVGDRLVQESFGAARAAIPN